MDQVKNLKRQVVKCQPVNNACIENIRSGKCSGICSVESGQVVFINGISREEVDRLLTKAREATHA